LNLRVLEKYAALFVNRRSVTFAAKLAGGIAQALARFVLATWAGISPPGTSGAR
jgi:hypothetical protein